MAIYKLDDIHSSIEDKVVKLITEGYSIDYSNSSTKDKNSLHIIFSAPYSTNYHIEIHTSKTDCTFTEYYMCIANKSPDDMMCEKKVYHRAYNDIYADSDNEARAERNKWYADHLGVSDTDNPLQAFADKLGVAISSYFKDLY